ncbi:LysR family transcriptional regulator [Aquabacter sp. P-9]|uniref:LysR family transcriptional regulator n=1 Tax=Aquabacter sediminis TaxID=3029197 RepID=UPI00237DCCE8|nr:LysR substrate-binding domain-containing protein [Aquabacter sp. P-9]MDE1567530.1 LysR substrate-binding domain-containing protein [Aquabacter sp. P-9]
MDDAALRYFLEVVQVGSIAEASARLNVAASAISRQIAKLEADLGTQLFERRSRRLVLNAAGELLAQHARRTRLGEEQVVAEIRRLKGLERGLVRVGCTEGFGTDFVPRTIGMFRGTYPGISFEMHVAAPRETTRMVSEGIVDVGLSFGFVPDAGIRVELAGSAPLVALMAPDHPLAGRTSVTLAEVADYPVGLSDKDTTARQLFDILCGVEGVVIEPVMTTNYMAGLWSFAEIGGGIIMTGRITAATRLSRFRMQSVPLQTRASTERRYEIQTMQGRVLPEATRIFVAFLADELRRLDPQGV